MSRFRIEPKVKFVRWSVYEFGVVSSRIEASTHEHQFFSKSRAFRVDRNGQREICDGAALVNGDLIRKLMNHPQQKVRGILVDRLDHWPALRHLSQLVGRMIEPRRPCAQPGHRTVLLLPLLGILFSP